MSVDVILCDIEGTTSSIEFVHNVMFPLAERQLDVFLEKNQNDPQLQEGLGRLKQFIAAAASKDVDSVSVTEITGVLRDMIRNDIKDTFLKQVQGKIWKESFEAGTLKGHLYPDVAPAFKTWHDSGKLIAIYSSGSIEAQKQYFGHSDAGNLLDYLCAHFDTTTGPKKEIDSYLMIAKELDKVRPGVTAESILFLSDVADELKAARQAGMKTVLLLRPDNKKKESAETASAFFCVENFSDIDPDRL